MVHVISRGTLSDLVLLACAQDEVIVGNLSTTGHQHVFGRLIDGHHLSTDHVDKGAQRDVSQLSAVVAAGGKCSLTQ